MMPFPPKKKVKSSLALVVDNGDDTVDDVEEVASSNPSLPATTKVKKRLSGRRCEKHKQKNGGDGVGFNITVKEVVAV